MYVVQMNLRLQLVEDLAADKITKTDHVIISLPTVKKKLCFFLTSQNILCGCKKKQ